MAESGRGEQDCSPRRHQERPNLPAEPARSPLTPREELRRRVRDIAGIAADEKEFFTRLTEAGVLVKLRLSTHTPGEVTGYAVGLPEHRTAGGETVWYGGGRLAPDLTLPQLRSRWTGTVPSRGGTAARLAAAGSVPLDVSRRAAEAVRDATAAMRAGSPAAASAIAYAAVDLLRATANAWEERDGGPLAEAAEWFDRAAHQVAGRVPARRVAHVGHLRRMARLVSVMGHLSRDRDTAAALHLIYTLAALAESLADLREAQNRLHQARAARHAAVELRAWTVPVGAAAQPAPAPAEYQRETRSVGPQPHSRSARR